jgi:hypothetical protein
MYEFIAGGIGMAMAGGLAAAVAWKKNLHCWVPSWLASHHEAFDSSRPLHLYFTFVDHYEPLWQNTDEDLGAERIRLWQREYPKLVDSFRDSQGRVPQHSFFFPAEEYRPRYLDMLKDLCSQGYGDVEIHLHHDNDTEENFIDTMEAFIEQLQQHGFMLNRPRRERFGFIHGNWCLDNSRRDGRWCGINNEIQLLAQMGCYADFTYPSAPSETQPNMANAIYYARDDAEAPKSHNRGRPACVGVIPVNDELCLITGPLGLDWGSRKFGIIPRIENSDVSGGIIADERRVRHWMRLGARVLGAPNHVFVKVHTHGTQERLYPAVLGDQAREMYRALCNLKDEGVVLHFVTAYETFKAIRALEQGLLQERENDAEAKAQRAAVVGAGGRRA